MTDMGSIIKTISLDGRTQKIADTIPNFSQWVRAQLLKLEETRLMPRQGYQYNCNECGTYWTHSKPMEFYYCRTDGCKNTNDIVTTVKVVDLE